MAEEINIKKKLHALCLLQIEERIHALESANELARAAQQDDTKSSAGDKFETSREMMTQEIEKNTSLLADVKQQKQAMLRTPLTQTNAITQRGSVVETNHESFYIAVSVGVIKCEEKTFQTISPASPVCKVLLGKKAGDTFSFNGKEYIVMKLL
jgi:transcription elongation GreA/GreB family factor